MLEGHEKCVICLMANLDWPLPLKDHAVIPYVEKDKLAEELRTMVSEKLFDIGRYSHGEPLLIIDSLAAFEDMLRGGLTHNSMECFQGRFSEQQFIFEGVHDRIKASVGSMENFYPIHRRAEYGEDPIERLVEKKEKMPPSSLLTSLLKRFRVKEGYEKPDSEKSWGPMFSNPNNADDCARS